MVDADGTGDNEQRGEQRGKPDEHDQHIQFTELDYEQARDQLIEVVQGLEAGGLSLEQSLGLWEKGEALAQVCERHLEGARERIDAKLASVEDVHEGEQEATHDGSE